MVHKGEGVVSLLDFVSVLMTSSSADVHDLRSRRFTHPKVTLGSLRSSAITWD